MNSEENVDEYHETRQKQFTFRGVFSELDALAELIEVDIENIDYSCSHSPQEKNHFQEESSPVSGMEFEINVPIIERCF